MQLFFTFYHVGFFLMSFLLSDKNRRLVRGFYLMVIASDGKNPYLYVEADLSVRTGRLFYSHSTANLNRFVYLFNYISRYIYKCTHTYRIRLADLSNKVGRLINSYQSTYSIQYADLVDQIKQQINLYHQIKQIISVDLPLYITRLIEPAQSTYLIRSENTIT